MKTPAEAADHFEQPPAGSNAASIVASDRLNEARAVSGIHQGTPSPQAAPVPAAPAPVPAPARADGIVTTNQTVEVAASPTADLSTSNAEVAHPLIGNTILQHPLPSKLPILSMVSSAHRILAIDTNNAVFFSDDDGTTWNAVPAQWRGRAVTVSLVASGTAGTFASHARTATLSATNTPSANLQASQQSQASAALTGTVTDRSGAVIPDASVVVGNSTTPNLRTMKTDRTGHYLIDDLVPGSYRVEVEALGFNKQQLDVSISASQQNLANFTLIVGNATQTVSVEAAAEPRVTLSVPKKKDAARTSANQQQAVFEMTTDTGDRWTSADGHIWKHQ
jgi:hypothetical protein